MLEDFFLKVCIVTDALCTVHLENPFHIFRGSGSNLDQQRLDFYIVFSTHLLFECSGSSQAWRRQKQVAGELKCSASRLLFIHRGVSLEDTLLIYAHMHLQLQRRSLSVPDWSQKKKLLYEGREHKHLCVYLLLCVQRIKGLLTNVSHTRRTEFESLSAIITQRPGV